jgi:hypothetical protein
MKKLLFLSIIIASFSAIPATAQFVTADGIGIYFDETDPGSGNMATSGPFEPITAYLLLTNPSSRHFFDGEFRAVSGWECMVTVGGGPVAEEWVLAGQQPLNIKMAPEFVVGVGEEALALPISVNDAVLLATYSCYIMAATDEVAFRVDPLVGSSFDPLTPGYAAAHDSGVLIPLTPNAPATINTTLANSPTDGAAVPVTSTQIDLSWTDNSDDESGFVIYRTFHDEGIGWEITELDTFTVGVDVASYSDTDCLPNSEYSYRIFSQKTIGDPEFNSAQYTTGIATAMEGPTAPSNLVVAAQSATELLLTWTDNSSNEDLFRISRHTMPTGVFVDIATVGADITSYLDSGLEAGDTYYYRVVASNAIGDSEYIQSNGTTFSPPTQPTNLNLAPVSNSQINLGWTDNSDDEDGFRIYRGTSAGDMPLLAEVTTDVVAYSDTGLSPHTQYFYKVSSFNVYGESESGTNSESTLNSDPTINLDGLSVVFDEDGSTIVDLAAYINDDDGDALILTATNSTNIFAAVDGFNVTFTATENWNGSEELTFTVDDQQGRAVASDATTVVVSPVNDAPTIDLTSLTIEFVEDGNTTIDFTGYVEDIDSSGLTIAASIGTEITADVTGMTILFSATENWNGSETFTITVGDGQYETSDDIIVTVTAENDVPTIGLPDSFSFNEDENLVEDFTSYLNDIEGDDLILTATNSTNIFAVIAGFSVTFTATENWSGSEELTFTVNDQQGRAVASDAVMVIVSPVNDAPTIDLTSLTIEFAEDGNTTIDFTSYVEDIDSSGLTIAISVGTEITADVTGMTIIFSATENWSGSETFTITVGDGQYEASDDVIVTVTPENDVPTIVLPDSFSFNEDESLVEDFTSYLNDIDGDDLILTATNSANIFAAVAGFSVTFTATENWSGSEELTFTINDQLGRAIASDTISINVISQDDGIEVTELLPAEFVQEIIELDTINFSITAADPDGNPLEYLWQLDGVDVSITPTYDFVTDYESEGNYNVTLNVTDNFTRNTLDYSWDVAVAKNNRTPSADDLTATVIEDEFVAITLSGSDPDEDVLTFSVVDPPAHGVFAGGTYTPDADYFGPDLFTYISNDGSLDSDPATVTITVTAVNDAPVINLSAASIVFTQNTTTTVDFASYVSDVDSGSLTLTAEGNLDITVSIDGLMVVFGTVDSEYTGSEVVTFTVTDGQYPASDATTITVNGLADTPATPTNLTLTLVGTDAIDLSWIDNSINEDGFRIYRGTASGSLTLLAEVAANNTSYSDTGLAPHTEYFYNVSAFNAFGESGMSDEQSESTPNTSPVIDLAGLNVVFAEDLGTAINIEPYINDDDGDELIITATSSANIFAVVDGFNVAFTATENWNGSEELTFTVNDQQGRAVASDVTTVVVDPVNDTPTIDLTSLSIEFAEDGNTTIDFTGYVEDIDSSGLTIAASVGTEITADVTGMTILFSATENWSGSETFTITVGDGQYEASDDVVVTVTPENDVPTIVLPDSFSFNEDESLVEDFTSYLNDIDGDDLILTATNSANIFAVVDGFNVAFTATENWNGSEELTFTVNDQQGRAIASDVTTVVVDPVNDAPTIDLTSLSVSFTQGTTIDVDFAEYVEDIDLDVLTLSALGNDNITVDINGLIATFGTANPEFTGFENIVFTVFDGEFEDQETTTVTVNALEGIPTPPSDLALTVNGTEEISLLWVDNSINEDGFRVYRGLAGDNFSLLAEVSANETSYTDNGLTQNTTYYYHVTSYNSFGESTPQEAQSATTEAELPIAPIVTAATSSSSEILLEWTDSIYEDGYKVYRSEVGGELGVLVAELPADQLEFLDDVTLVPGRTPDTEYWYIVEAFNIAGEVQSAQVSAMTLDIIPECPDNLLLEVLSDTEIAMTWTDNSDNELKFAIWRSQVEGDCGVLVAEVPVDVTFWQDGGLELATDYWYCVYAYNEIGQCLTPASGGATTLNPVPTITSIEDVPSDEGGFVTVNFTRSIMDTGDGVGENYSIEIFTDESWTEVGNEQAVGDDTYSVIVLLPETGTISEPISFQFRVLAVMDEGGYLSEEMSGYAIDNLAPAVDLLTALSTQEGVVLEWSAAIVPDLQHFVVTRREFGGDMVEIGTSMTVSFLDADPEATPGEQYYYSVYGVDIHENIGDPADEAQVSFPQPTQLSGFTAEAIGTGVEIAWELSDLDQDVSFIVKRSDAGEDNYVVLDMPVVQLNELVFTVSDSSVQPAESYIYRIDFEIDSGSWLLFETGVVQMPEMSYALYQNSPNPFNPLTTISYDLNKASTVKLTVYDIAGRAVRHLVDSPGESAGRHFVKWFGRDDSGHQVTSGVYFYVIQAGEFKQSKRMLLLK